MYKKERLLADRGYAKPFQVRGHKAQQVKGTMEIRDGRITDPRFTWQDIED